MRSLGSHRDDGVFRRGMAAKMWGVITYIYENISELKDSMLQYLTELSQRCDLVNKRVSDASHASQEAERYGRVSPNQA